MKGGNSLSTHFDNSHQNDAVNLIIVNASEKFKILSEEARIRIIWALYSERECCVGELANILSTNSSALSHHLRILRHANVVKSRRTDKHIIYSISDKTVIDLIKLFMN